ncbi:MAG: hypothetical protein WB439_09160 [Acidobacteriaceae bacterium]
MIWSFLLYGVSAVAAVAIVILLVSLFSPAAIPATLLQGLGRLLLVVAALSSGLLLLLSLAAAAWGMNTRLPWGLGIWMYLMPVLGLPAFLLLRITSVRILSRVLWLLTIASSFAFYFGDRADRIASGFQLLSNPRERLGMFLNAFTLALFAISVLLQLASICERRRALT